jgi:CHAT domain-containing protein/Tfp pilus assembly protein PilF
MLPVLLFALLASILTGETTELLLGKPIVRDLAGGEKHRYHVNVPDGQYVRVVVEQRGIDIVARLVEPDGKIRQETDSGLRPQDQETVEFVRRADMSQALEIEGKYKAFRPGSYVVKLVESRPAVARDTVLDEARALSSEAGRLRVAGKSSSSQPLAERVLAIREKELGDHPETAYALQNLARILEDQGEYDRSQALALRALHIRETVLGRDHPDVALSLNVLAVTHQNREEFDKSIELQQRAIRIYEKSLGLGHPAVAVSLTNVGPSYRLKGDLVRAEEVFRRALGILEKVLGPDHRNVAAVANNLGLVYDDKADYPAAAAMFRRSAAILEKTLGSAHPVLRDPLMNLANTYTKLSEHAKAEPLYERVLKIVENSLGPAHPALGSLLFNFGSSLRYKGDYARAEAVSRRALTIREGALGTDHPSVARVLDSLAVIYEAQGKLTAALEAEQRASHIAEREIDLNLASGSERQKLAYLSLLAEWTGHLISFGIRNGDQWPESVKLAANAVLQRKGRVQEAIANTFAGVRQRSGPEDRKLLDEWNQTTSQLSKLVLNGPQQGNFAEHQNKIKSFEDRRETLEEKLSRQAEGFFERSRSVTLNAIQRRIPERAALIEFALYRPVDLQARIYSQRLLPPRYAALVVRSTGPVQLTDLGPAKPIDGAILALRAALRNAKRQDVRALARALHRKIMEPLLLRSQDTELLLISPDGALNLVPFSALVNERGQYEIQRYSLTYLTSGRDLLRMASANVNPFHRAMIVADPEFGELASLRPGEKDGRANRSIAAKSDLGSVYFAPLPGTAREAHAIAALFPKAVVLTGRHATELALKEARAPSILHIATHGFFFDDASAALELTARIDNPLLRSGVALAGANRNASTGQDGILTALEASGLNLWGTRLVTLSACDTGLGEVRNSEGVYGFRRALVLAGAETLVMSLWQVSDHVTRELMTAYYTGLKNGQGRGASLRQIQLKMIGRKDRQHAFYWAAFIQSGEWANLEGSRE